MKSRLGAVLAIIVPLLGGCVTGTNLAGSGDDVDAAVDADVPADADARTDAEAGTDEDGLDVVDDACSPIPELCDGIDNDCDGLIDETFDFRNDIDNCGGCGFSCRDLPHAETSCSVGVCRIDVCVSGWVDQNGSVVDGCEYPCTPTAPREYNEDDTCWDGADNDCDGRTDCTDTDCECGCLPEVCNLMDDDCDGLTDEDFDLDYDVDNCGSCGTVCPDRLSGTPFCSLGECYLRCFDGSEIPADHPCACTGCCPSPDPSETACDGVDDDCDGMTDEDYIPFTCGAGACQRNSTCWRAVEDCREGSGSAEVCNGVDDDCDGATDEGFELSVDPANCGSCGNACAPAHASGATCTSGACDFLRCDSGWGNCDGNRPNGCETSLATLANCGLCDTSCELANATESCATGTCTLVGCDAGWGNCDGVPSNGCETSLDTFFSCGGCGVSCDLPPGASAARCIAGVCRFICYAGWGNCDGEAANGCETSLATLANCGSCGTSCELANAGESCATGACTLLGCDAGWGNCDGEAASGCETNLLTSNAHCGSCGNDCGQGSFCTGGSCA